MDRGLLQAARAATAGDIMPFELPDIWLSDCRLVKKVAFADDKQREPFPLRQQKSRSSSRSETRKITLDHGPLLTPHETSTTPPKSLDIEVPSTPHLKSRGETSGSSLKDELMSRRYSSPNPLPLTDNKLSLKKSLSLPPSPLMTRRRGYRANSASRDVRAAMRPNSDTTNSFSKSRSQADNTRLSTSYSKPSVGPQSIFNDPEINPILISPEQIPMTPSNMHMRHTGFELRHRVMRRAFRLSDLSGSGSSDDQHTVDVSSTSEGAGINKDQREETTRALQNRAETDGGLEQQFKVLQHCRYLRYPVGDLP